MKRSSFIKSLGVLAGAAFIPESKIVNTEFKGRGYPHPYERMRIYSNGNVGFSVLNPTQKFIISNKK